MKPLPRSSKAREYLVRLERRVDLARLRHALGQRDPDDAVAPNADGHRLLVGCSRAERLDRLVADDRAEVAVVGAGRAAPLDVAEHGDSDGLAEPRLEHLLQPLGRDRAPQPVGGALRQHDNRVAPAGLAAGIERRHHLALPVVRLRRLLGEEHPVGARRQRAHQRQVAAVPTHHLDDERAPVARGRAGDGVDRLGDPVQRRVGTDGHVGAVGVVVDRADQADDGQARVAKRGVERHREAGDQLVEQVRPLAAEHVGTGEAAIAADDDEVVDPGLEERARDGQTALARPEPLGPRGADDRAAAVDDAADRVPRHLADGVAPLDQAVEPFVDPVDFEPVVERRPHHCADGRVHSRRIAAARQDPNSLVCQRRAPCF